MQAGAAPKLFVQGTKNIEVIYYSPNHEYLVRHLIRAFENALEFQRNLFRYTPSGKVTVLLEDFGDHGHGGAGTVPTNFISVGLAPFSYTYETLPANERMSWVMNHEMVHIVMGDNAGASDRAFRRIFGGKVMPTAEQPESMAYSYLASPRHYSARWFHEGIAAFMETWMAGGLGRALGGFDEMVFRALVRDESYLYDVVGIESEGSAIDFQTGANSYLYGTRFLTWLAKARGSAKLLEWVTRGDREKKYFTSRFKQVYGEPIEVAWRKWIAEEKQWQRENLERIRKYPVTRPERLVSHTLGSVSRPWYDTGRNKIYAAVRYPGKMAHLAEIDAESGAIEHLKDLKGSALYYVTSVALDPAGRKLFFTSDNNSWRDLRVYDLETRRSKLLQEDIRTGDLAWNAKDGSLWGIRHNDGVSGIVRMEAPYTSGKVLHEFPYGTDLFDIDVSPDGRHLSGAITNASGQQKLVRFEVEKLIEGEARPEELHDFEYNAPGNFVYSPDGRYLYGSSYQTGASNIFRYDTAERKMEVLSNAETGLFRPLPLADGRLMVFEYTAQGFVAAWSPTKPLEDVEAVLYLGQSLLEKEPGLKKWKLPQPSTYSLEGKLTRAGSYSPLKETRIHSIYPIVQGYKDSAAGGVRIEFGDRLSLSKGEISVSYSPDSSLKQTERLHAAFSARLWDWKLSGYFNNADFYDLFGPTKVSRKGQSLRLDKTHNLLYDSPRTMALEWNVAGYAGLERLPDYQNVAVQHERFLRGNVALKYSYLDRSIGAIEDEKGTNWEIASRLTYADREAFPRIHASFNRGFLLPLRNSSVWLRSSAGQAFGQRQDSFASYYFGGFGNNWIDHENSSRYREYYSFPGVDLNAIAARSFVKAMVEWDLPPVKFRRMGNPLVYANWARLATFTSGLAGNSGGSDRVGYMNAGAQLDVRVVLFTYLNTTFSAGYAAAVDRNGRWSREYMISLKIL